MSADLHHFWTPNNVFQAAGTTVDWEWDAGEGDDYWGFSIRPTQFNSGVEILRQFTTSDNGTKWTEHFTVKSFTGGLNRFSAIRVVGA